MKEDHTDEWMLWSIKTTTGYEPGVPEPYRADWIAWMRKIWTGYVDAGVDFGTAAILTVVDMRSVLQSRANSSAPKESN